MNTIQIMKARQNRTSMEKENTRNCTSDTSSSRLSLLPPTPPLAIVTSCSINATATTTTTTKDIDLPDPWMKAGDDNSTPTIRTTTTSPSSVVMDVESASLLTAKTMPLSQFQNTTSTTDTLMAATNNNPTTSPTPEDESSSSSSSSTTTKPLSFVDKDGVVSSLSPTTSTVKDDATTTTSTMIEDMITKHPDHFQESSSKLHALLSLLSTPCCSHLPTIMADDVGTSLSTTTTTTATSNTVPILPVVDALKSMCHDMMSLQQQLVVAESRITELQNKNTTTATTNENNTIVDDTIQTREATTNMNRNGSTNTDDTTDSSSRYELQIHRLEKELSVAQTMIQQLKTQKQHIIGNTKKKKILYDEMERKLSVLEKEIQKVSEEKNVLQSQLYELKDLCDTMKQKLRNQQEIVKDSKTSMMEMKQKLAKTEHMRSLENELLDNFRKLAIHTGYYRWGKPIRLLEVAIAAAAAGEETTISSTDQDFE